MNEPTSKKIFFWTLVVLFFITSTTVILYAFGYRFSTQKGVFIYAGSVTLNLIPQEADVYINGVLIPNKKLSRINNSYHIDGITPGNYLVEVKSPGFNTWTKRVSVHSGVSTEFWNIVLTKNSYAREDYETPGIQRFYISPRKNLAALTEQINNEFMVKIFDPETLEIKDAFWSTEYSFTKDEKENIEWAPQAHRIIIPAEKSSGEKNYFIKTVDTDEQVDLRQITEAENLSHVRWDPKSKDVLFYMSNDSLFRLDLDAPEEKKLIAEHIASYDLSSSGLYYFQLPEGIVYQTSFDGVDTPVQITKTGPDSMNDPLYQITVYDKKRITFLNRSHELYMFNEGEVDTYFRKLSSNAFGTQFSDDGKKVLYWNDHEISAYFIRKWEVQPVREENENILVTRFSQEIKNVQWTRDYEHALFTVDKKVKMVELDNRDKPITMDVLTLKDDSSLLVANFADGKLYYTEKNDQGQNMLHAIYFPERISFFGNRTE